MDEMLLIEDVLSREDAFHNGFAFDESPLFVVSVLKIGFCVLRIVHSQDDVENSFAVGQFFRDLSSEVLNDSI